MMNNYAPPQSEGKMGQGARREAWSRGVENTGFGPSASQRVTSDNSATPCLSFLVCKVRMAFTLQAFCEYEVRLRI